MQPFVANTLAQLQPNALAFNGCINQDSKNTTPANCITPNSLRWIGTESGQAPQDTWSAGYSGAGDPASDIYQPSEADTTLQNWWDSDIFDDDRFGSPITNNSDHIVTTGRWAYTPVLTGARGFSNITNP